MTKENILDYVMNSPENTNRMVLSDMLDELVNSSSGSVLITQMVDGYTDKTTSEIKAAFLSGTNVLWNDIDNYRLLTRFTENEGYYEAVFDNNLLISSDGNSGMYYDT